MSGDFIRSRRAAGAATTAQQAKLRGNNWPMAASGALLLSWLVVAGVGTRTVMAEEATPATARVSDETQQGDLVVAPGSKPNNSAPETSAREPDAQISRVQTPAASGGVLSPEAETSRQPAKESAKSLSKDQSKNPAVPQLVLPADVAKKIGQKIWLNETGGKVEAITSWNANEEFASLGVGHFIWFPVGKWLPFEESFPALLEFMRQRHVRLPAWLDKPQIPANRWTSRADFKKNFNSPEMRELRQFLLNTVAEQTQFLVARAQGAMDKILKNTPDEAERAHIIAQFSRIARGSKDLYPQIDYINFKGEGTNPVETAADKQTGKPQGWGFKQVLLKMNGSTDDPKAVRAEFADAAQAVLQQRVRNIPSNRVFEVGWLRRVDSYRRPIMDLETSAKRAQIDALGARAAR